MAIAVAALLAALVFLEAATFQEFGGHAHLRNMSKLEIAPTALPLFNNSSYLSAGDKTGSGARAVGCSAYKRVRRLMALSR
jgi:hypothetical protein